MTDDLKERYIHAATRGLPVKMRKDVADELRSLVDDMLSARCGETPPTGKDLRVVLTELGSPRALAEQYDADRKNCLIGPSHYRDYRFVLRVVLLCVAFGICLSGVLSHAVAPPGPWYAGALPWLGTLVSSLLWGFSFVTALFAIFYHRDIAIPFNREAGLDNLPPVPPGRRPIPRWEPLLGIGLSIVFFLVLLAVPQVFVVVLSGEVVPLFHAEAIRGTWYIIALFAALGIARDIVRLLVGRHTAAVMLASVAADVLSAGLWCWWLSGDALLNPRVADSLSGLFSGRGGLLEGFWNAQSLVLAAVLLALFLDALTAVIKFLQNGR